MYFPKFDYFTATSRKIVIDGKTFKISISPDNEAVIIENEEGAKTFEVFGRTEKVDDYVKYHLHTTPKTFKRFGITITPEIDKELSEYYKWADDLSNKEFEEHGYV